MNKHLITVPTPWGCHQKHQKQPAKEEGLKAWKGLKPLLLRGIRQGEVIFNSHERIKNDKCTALQWLSSEIESSAIRRMLEFSFGPIHAGVRTGGSNRDACWYSVNLQLSAYKIQHILTKVNSENDCTTIRSSLISLDHSVGTLRFTAASPICLPSGCGFQHQANCTRETPWRVRKNGACVFSYMLLILILKLATRNVQLVTPSWSTTCWLNSTWLG